MAADLVVRWLTPEDAEAAWELARDSDLPGVRRGQEAFTQFLASGLNNGLLALREGQVVGLLLYRVRGEDGVLVLLGVQVVPAHRRQGVGTALLERLRRHVQGLAEERVEVLVNERQLAVQLFLRACGFRARCVLPCLFEEGRSDGYLFRLDLKLSRTSV